jgi:hypothetical protein
MKCLVRDEDGALLIVRRPDVQPLVQVLEAGQSRAGKALSLGVNRYVRMVKESGMEDAKHLLASPPPFLLLWAYDYLNHRTHQLIAPREMLAEKSEWFWLRVEPWKDATYLQQVVEFGAWEPCQAVPDRR